jgi:hypothetical protein
MHFVVYSDCRNSCIYCAEYCTRRFSIYEGNNTYSINCCKECERNKLDNIRYLLFQVKTEDEYKNEVKYWKKETSFYKKEYEYYKEENKKNEQKYYELLHQKKPKPKFDLFGFPKE